MGEISFDLSRISVPPGWNPAGGLHSQHWRQPLTGFQVAGPGGPTTLTATGGVDVVGSANLAILSATFGAFEVPGVPATGGLAASLTWSNGGQDALLRLNLPWNAIKNIEIDHFEGRSLTLENWVDPWVHLPGDQDREIVILGAKRGEVTTGGGRDYVGIAVDSNGGWSNHFLIDTGAGDDFIRVWASTVDYSGSFDRNAYHAGWTTTTIRAGSGNDNIATLSGGADVIDGGDGYDTFFPGGGYYDHRFFRDVNGDVLITTNGFTDRLTNVELLELRDFSLNIAAEGDPPDNDEVAGAHFMYSQGGVRQMSIRFATVTDSEPPSASPALHHSVWFGIDPDFSSQVAINVTMSNYDTVIDVFTEELDLITSSSSGRATMQAFDDDIYYLRVSSQYALHNEFPSLHLWVSPVYDVV